MNQQEIFTYIQKQYPTHPDTINKSGYLVTIFKNPRTAAPYAIFYQPAERTTFMEVQAEPDMIGNYIEMYHLAPAKHMDQKHWLAVPLDGSVSDSKVLDLLDMSYDLVDGQEEAEKQFYVNTTAKPVQKDTQDNKDNKDTDEGKDTGKGNGAGSGSDTSYQTPDAGGYSNGEAAYSGGSGGSTDGGEASGNGSVPRVIVTGFTTDPAEVRAGSNFKLTIHLKNTSKMKVSNMLFDLSAPTEGSDEQTTSPAFLPSSGASSIYLDSIAPNGTADISIELNAKSDLLQKPYNMELSMKYEDPNATQVEGSSSISIPVKQDARFEISNFEISPQSVAVGEEANVMCSLYNLGRIKLYNVKATFEGKNIKKSEVFIGNIESGATGSIDAMLEGKKISDGPAKVTMTLSYEDESGNISTTTKDLNLEVTEKVDDDEAAASDMPEETQKSFPVIPVVIAAVVIAVVAAVVILKKRKKKQLAEIEEEELLDELERSSEDEHQ